MSETQSLLAKISALRQRLEQANGLAGEARSAAEALEADDLPARLAEAAEHDAGLDSAVAPLTQPEPAPEGRAPQQLTSRARRVLERGQGLLAGLRALADDFASGLLTPFYQQTLAIIDTVLRTVALLPDSAAAQLRLCQGLEAVLDIVAARLRTLTAGRERRCQESAQVGRLAGLLKALHSGEAPAVEEFHALAEQVLGEARDCAPLRFLSGDPADGPRFVAGHGLTVARVGARVVGNDPELRARARDLVVAALLHDVGMLGVPAEVLAKPGPLDDSERRAVEGHCRAGADLVARWQPDAPWLAEAVLGHHERLDGTGYPDGLKDGRLRPLTRLLGVCDVYSALACARPHRPARPTRTALADTLLLAEEGKLDRHAAACLLELSFYPVGSVVELAHGEVGVVVATPGPRRGLSAPARPVVALLTDSGGELLARPHHLDLAACEGQGIVRTLSDSERRELLGRRFPEWAA
jgi:hypothetical protein